MVKYLLRMRRGVVENKWVLGDCSHLRVFMAASLRVLSQYRTCPELNWAELKHRVLKSGEKDCAEESLVKKKE